MLVVVLVGTSAASEHIRSDGHGYQSKIYNRDTYYTTEFSG